MGVRSVLKGGGFERKQATRLSLWASGGTRQDVYWRSSLSGGRATVGARGHGLSMEAHAGDLVCTHACGYFLTQLFRIECKAYQALYLDRMVWGHAGVMHIIWEPTADACRDTTREPLVIAREDYQREIVMTTELGMSWLQEGATSPIRVTAVFPQWGAYVTTFREVLTAVSPEKLRRFSETVPTRTRSSLF